MSASLELADYSRGDVVYLLGISHSFQERTFRPFVDGGPDRDPSKSCRFEKYLEDVVKQIQPRVIGEESDDSILRGIQSIDSNAYSVAKSVSERHNITHLYCDPNPSEREQLYTEAGTNDAYDRENGYPVREGEWLRRISPFLRARSLLFICGATHVDSFKEKLEQEGVTVDVISRDLEREWNDACHDTARSSTVAGRSPIDRASVILP